MDRREMRAGTRWRAAGRLGRIAVAAALAATALAAPGGAGAACRTPAPHRQGDPRAVTPDGTTVRGGGSWTGAPGAHTGAERPGAYLFADGSADGVLIVAGAQSGTTSVRADTQLGTDGHTTRCVEANS